MAELHPPKKRKHGVQNAFVIDRPVVLVGMMGVGKTSIGKRLAARLGTPFVDADEEIEKAAKFSFADEFIDKLPNKYDTIIEQINTAEEDAIQEAIYRVWRRIIAEHDFRHSIQSILK